MHGSRIVPFSRGVCGMTITGLDIPRIFSITLLMQDTTHFGFETIPAEEKQSRVNEVFASVANKYDLMNDAMSVGVHRLWKDYFVRQLPLRNPMQWLDLAGGTGDIATRIVQRAEKEKLIDLRVTVTDINPAMLEEGKRRALDNNTPHLIWQVADAQALPFADNSMDGATIAFGIRNVPDIKKALAEVYRVLKHGSAFYCLEFSPQQPAFIKQLYDAYSFHCIPWLGEKLTGDRASYQYLVESIRQFPAPSEFSGWWQAAGFARVKHEPLSLGVAVIHSGWKL